MITHYKDIDTWKDSTIRTRLRALKEERCGACTKWMIKRLCKREEKHVVHMNEYPCNDFVRKGYYVEQIEELERELVMRNI